MKNTSMHKVGVGGVYQTKDKRGSAVADCRYSQGFPYFVWVAKYDGKTIGEGKLNECRKLVQQAALIAPSLCRRCGNESKQDYCQACTWEIADKHNNPMKHADAARNYVNLAHKGPSLEVAAFMGVFFPEIPPHRANIISKSLL